MKKALALVCLCLTAPVWTHPSAAERLTLAELLQTLKTREATVQDVQFDFKQTLRVSGGPEETVEGRAFFKTPHRFRIERASGRKQIFICDGKRFWIYTPSFKQVLVASWKGWAKTQQMPPGWIDFQNYVDRLESDFTLSLEDSTNPNVYVLDAHPKKGNDSDILLKLWVDPAGFLPNQTEIQNGSTDIKTWISQTGLNQKPEDSLFTFQPGNDTEMIRL